MVSQPRVSRPAAPARPPRVSVLLPVRDAASHLEAALESLARQSFPDFEVIGVDDGSRDGSGEMLDRFARRDSRFHVVHRPPEGLVTALNTGLELCRGPWVARMDADDIAHPRRLELQLAATEADRRLDVVSSRVRFFPAAAVGRGARLYEDWLNRLLSHEDILRERFVECPIPHPSALVRRRVLEAARGWDGGGDGGPGWPEDYDLWLRLAAAGARFGKVPEVLLFWREHERRLTRTDPRYGVDRFLAVKARHLAAGPLAGADRVVVWGAGRTGRRLTSGLIAHGVTPVAFLDIDPAKVGRAPRGVPVQPPEALCKLRKTPGETVVLVAVASRGARPRIRAHLADLELREGRDYWCVA